MKKSKILCKTVHIKDLYDEKIYTPREYKENAELKKFVNKKNLRKHCKNARRFLKIYSSK